jgi:hypothetical protein
MSRTMTNKIARNEKSSEPANVNTDHQAIEALAYQLWVLRGSPIGAPAVDWVRAEEELRNAMKSVRRGHKVISSWAGNGSLRLLQGRPRHTSANATMARPGGSGEDSCLYYSRL